MFFTLFIVTHANIFCSDLIINVIAYLFIYRIFCYHRFFNNLSNASVFFLSLYTFLD